MDNQNRSWLMPVVAICVLQALASFLSRLIPVVAPAMAAEYGWDGSSIGYLTAGNAWGALIILMVGSGMLRHLGGTRMLQLVLLLGSFSMGLFLTPSLALALVACFAMGMSTGVASPAGSEVLQRFSPPGMRNLIFSIKQAGVPLGGMLAGLLVPAVVALAGWRAALLVCGVLVAAPVLLTWRLGPAIDGRETGEPEASTAPTTEPRFKRTLRSIAAPMASLRQNSSLMKMAIVGSLFAISQSVWFTFSVIYLVDRLDYSLALAGALYAVMQVGGVLGRVIMGWLSDRLQSARLTLTMVAIVAAVTTVLLGFTTSSWPWWSLVVLAFMAGASAASWNGVQIAEVARHSPPHLIAETSAGSASIVSIMNILAPVAIAVFVASTHRYDLAFIGAGLCTLLVLVFLPREDR